MRHIGLATAGAVAVGVATLVAPLLARAEGYRPPTVAIGGMHACVVTPAGAVKCWGNNNGGYLGVGTCKDKPKVFKAYRYSDVPVTPVGLTKDVVSVVGVGTPCVLTKGGGVKCWGENGDGSLGIGQTEGPETCFNTIGAPLKASTKPLDVAGLTKDVASLGGGYFVSCALTKQGAVKCWGSTQSLGSNQVKMPGTDFYIYSAKPVEIQGLRGVQRVSVGADAACALVAGGGVKCWGRNQEGQLGNGTYDDRGTGGALAGPAPVQPVGLEKGVRDVSAGGTYACALMEAGGVKCWGAKWSLGLGDVKSAAACKEGGEAGCVSHPDVVDCSPAGLSDRYCAQKPIDVPGLKDIKVLRASWGATCAIDAAGKIYVWGGFYSLVPKVVEAFGAGNVDCAANSGVAVAVKADGKAMSAGGRSAMSLSSLGAVPIEINPPDEWMAREIQNLP